MQHILHSLDGPLALTIRLRVKNHAKVQTRTQLVVKLLPKYGSKSHVSVRNHENRHFLSSYYLSDVDVSQLLSRNALLDRNEMGTLGQSIHDEPNRIPLPVRSGEAL